MITGSPKVDHVAIEVADIDHRVEALVATGAFRMLREGTSNSTGYRIFMLGDGTGFKIELIEAPSVTEPTFKHVALRVDDSDAAAAALADLGWTHTRGPVNLAAAKGRSNLTCESGFDLQVITYDEGSPDMVVWP